MVYPRHCHRCVAIDPACLDYASPGLLAANARFVKMAVQVDGGRLGAAEESLRDDRATVLLAVAQNGHALQFASENLKADKRVI